MASDQSAAAGSQPTAQVALQAAKPHERCDVEGELYRERLARNSLKKNGTGFRPLIVDCSQVYDDTSVFTAVSPSGEKGGRKRPGIPHSNICALCSEYIYIFRHRCLVCGRVYCRNCVGMGMGEMTEGRNVLTAWEEDLVQGKQILTKSHLNYYLTAQLFQHKYMLIKPKKMCFWITDSCPLTVKEVKHMPPFEILSLAGAVADALQI